MDNVNKDITNIDINVTVDNDVSAKTWYTHVGHVILQTEAHTHTHKHTRTHTHTHTHAHTHAHTHTHKKKLRFPGSIYI